MEYLISITKTEVVLTTGGDAVLYRAPDNATYHTIALPAKKDAIDTTGAGDSFNAAWLAGRAKGLSVETAIAWAAALAGEVVLHRGAIISKEAMLAYKARA